MRHPKGAILQKTTTGIHILFTVLAVFGTAKLNAELIPEAAGRSKNPALKLMGNRFLTFSTMVRVNQVETVAVVLSPGLLTNAKLFVRLRAAP